MSFVLHVQHDNIELHTHGNIAAQSGWPMLCFAHVLFTLSSEIINNLSLVETIFLYLILTSISKENNDKLMSNSLETLQMKELVWPSKLNISVRCFVVCRHNTANCIPVKWLLQQYNRSYGILKRK